MTIRRFREADKEHVLSLLGNAAWKQHIFDWQFSRCDENGPVVCEEDSNIIGFNGVMPIRVKIGDKIVSAAWSCDFMVDQEQRQTGIGGKLKHALNDDWPLIMALGISNDGQRALRRLGWKSVCKVPEYTYFNSADNFRTRVFARLQHTMRLVLSTSLRQPQNIKIIESQSLPATEIVDAFADRVATTYENWPIKDSNYLNWRYANSPFENYSFLTAIIDNEIIGICVIKKTPVSLSIVDLIAPRKSTNVRNALVGYLLDNYAHIGRIRCSTSETSLTKVLIQNGFLPSGLQSLLFFIKVNDANINPSNRWALMGGDSDTEFLNQAREKWGTLRTEFWDDKQLDNNQRAWDRLRKTTNADPLFMQWRWQSTWWRYFADKDCKLRIIACFHNEQLVALAPIYLHKTTTREIKTNRLRLIGSKSGNPPAMRSEYLQLMIAPQFHEQCSTSIVEEILKMKDFNDIVLTDSPQAENQTSTVFYKLGRHLYTRSSDINRANETRFIDLPSTFNEYVNSLSSNTRRALFHKRKFLEKHPDFAIEMATTETIPIFLEELNAFHNARWGKPAFDGDRLRFNIEIAQQFFTDGDLRLSRLRVGQDTVSVLFSLVAEGTEYNLQLGFDEKYDSGKLSLGILHLGYAIEAAIAEGRSRFDLLAGSGKITYYKERLCHGSTQLVERQAIRSRWRKYAYLIFSE